MELRPAASLRDSVRGRLEAEALAAKKINHINIPRLYDFGFENDQFVYVTEHFDGITFEAWVRDTEQCLSRQCCVLRYRS